MASGGRALVHQHHVGPVRIGIVFVLGLGIAGDANQIPLAQEDLAHPRAILPRLVFVPPVRHHFARASAIQTPPPIKSPPLARVTSRRRRRESAVPACEARSA